MAPDACAVLREYNWPGNVRELRNIVEAAAACSGSREEVGVLDVLECLPSPAAETPWNEPPSLAMARERAELLAILEAISRAGGSRERAAALLRVSPATLYRRLHGLLRPLAGSRRGGTQP